MQVSKWGNSLAVRLPAAVVEALELKDGDQIVTGRYRILRGLKSGTAVKIDNTVEVTDTEKS